jgi:hypothetical protein
MKYVLLILCLWCLTVEGNSQLISGKNLTMTGHSVYGEIHGASHGLTLNYERVLGRVLNRWNVSTRIGFGSYGKAQGSVRFVSIPAGLNLFRGRNGNNKELGFHIAYVKGKNYVKAGSFLRYSEGLYFTPSVGYRLQREAGGLLIRVQYAPFIKLKEYSDDSPFKMWSRRLTHSLGISVGYHFPQKR